MPEFSVASPRRGVEMSVKAPRVSPLPLRLRAAFWILCLGLGLIQAWQYRHLLPSDGLSYLDIATAYWSGDWKVAINAHWSPLYSWLIGFVLAAFHPAPSWEATAVHLLNIAILGFTIACFDFFLCELNRFEATRSKPDGDAVRMRGWALVAVGYALFMWSAIDLITVQTVTPDLCVAGFAYAAFGLLIRIRRGMGGLWTALLLGTALGLGYLAKAAVFPLAPVFLVAAAFAARGRAARWRVFASALVGFLVIAGPFVVVLSRTKGRLTFGETAKYNYARHVGGIVVAVHWRGEPAGTGLPAHPTRKIMEAPAVYEFAEPVGGTYPPFQDPSYWYEGASYNFRLGRQVLVALRNVMLYARLLLGGPVPAARALDHGILLLLVVLVFVGGKAMPSARIFARHWYLQIPVAAALSMYALVHVEARYIGAYLGVLLVVAFASLRLAATPESRRLVGVASLLVLALWLVPSAYSAVRLLPRLLRGQDPSGEVFQSRIAENLRHIGVRPGDRLGFIGEGFRFHWARMLGARVVAEIRQVQAPHREVGYADASEVKAAAAGSSDVDVFWGTDAAIRRRALAAFRSVGVSAVVSDRMPSDALAEGWTRIPDTTYGVYLLRQNAAAAIVEADHR